MNNSNKNITYWEAVVGWLLTDNYAFVKYHSKVSYKLITNPALAKLWQTAIDEYSLNNAYWKSIDEFKASQFFLDLESEERLRYYNLIDRTLFATTYFSEDKLRQILTNVCQKAHFMEKFEEARNTFHKDDTSRSWDILKQGMQETKDFDFLSDKYKIPFEDTAGWIQRESERRQSALSTGSKDLDEMLGGGFFPEEAVGILAPTNSGKTTFLVTVARHALVQKKKVLFYFHEGSRDGVRQKIVCAMLGIGWGDLVEFSKVSADRLAAMDKFLEEHLTLVARIETNGMWVDDVVADIKTRHEDLATKTGGQGYDLIINDYPKKLRSRYRKPSKDGLYRVELSEVYEQFVFLASELRVPVVVAIQSNRSGSKLNNEANKNVGKSHIGVDEVGEAFGIAESMAVVMSLNRSPEDKERDIIRISISKTRNSRTERVLLSRSNFECSLAFGDRKWLSNIHTYTPLLTKLNPVTGLVSVIQENNAIAPTDMVEASLCQREAELKSKNGNVGAYQYNETETNND